MEIILHKDVENLGFKDDIVTVKNGYGLNFLIPGGYGEIATPSAIKNLEETLKQRAKKEEKLITDAKTLATTLESIDLKIKAKVGAANKLFGSINSASIAEALSKEGQEIDRKFIKLPGNSIKKAGKHTAKIRLHREVLVDFDFEIIGEKEA
ncbi:50S ribosomal protein L9 [Flavobacteriaceae bacterium UJ101]|nr:50S ribosomal protein L9 [Flavobacteriaceae bacterium UJ101]